MAHLGKVKPTEGVADAVRATPEQTQEDTQDLAQDQAMTEKALKVLRAGKPDAYEKALAALRSDTRDGWEDVLDWEPDDYEGDQEPYKAGRVR